MIRRSIPRAVLLMPLIAALANACQEARPDRGSPATIDPVRRIQQEAVTRRFSPVAHWGPDPKNYIGFQNHSNRLVPIYTWGTEGAGPGIDLTTRNGSNSSYRREDRLKALFGAVPTGTLNPSADYMDQTDIHGIMEAAAKAGKKRIFLIIFDGMDWHMTRAAAVARSGKVYSEGRGTGLLFLDRTQGSQFGWFANAPWADMAKFDVDRQTVIPPASEGGYDASLGGPSPWHPGVDLQYLIGKRNDRPNPFTDSSASAVSMASGIKTYNYAINVTPFGKPVDSLPVRLQREGWTVGAVTSVTFPHATPASMYAVNVSRGDYQDLGRDMLGLPSISHPERPMPGLDLVIGCGHGMQKKGDANQGANFVPGNPYLTQADRKAIDVKNGGRYVVAERTAGLSGRDHLLAAARAAARENHRLFGFYGTKWEHLPYRTANGDYKPTLDFELKEEVYSAADLAENPTLADMTDATLEFIADKPRSFVMIEAGDVDWAMHRNNLDDAIGAVHSGDEAVERVHRWIESKSNWRDALVIVTADHGHLLNVLDPAALAPPN